MIKKLSQEVINQIAAGEVIEKPASVVKELVDNSIDAEATRIDITIKNGGKKYIEVSDNGYGIDSSELSKVFEAHTTSKIENIDDLNEALSMGFRGEALSTILSVAEVSAISRDKNSSFAYKIEGRGTKISEPKKHARDIGTSIVVEKLFENVPARLKYLRTDNTEYRKILEILIPYFLICPNIHFSLTSNAKTIYNLPQIPNTSPGTINQSRIKKILKSDFSNTMLGVFFDGDGTKIEGYVVQPEYNYEKTQHQYCFLNNRPIYDRGVSKAISQGFAGFIPHNRKVPYIININIKPSLVDVNVHPRKEEVKFLNPYRVYSAVERAVKEALSKHSVKQVQTPTSEPEDFQLKDKKRSYQSESKERNYKRDSQFNVESGLKFSEHLLKPKVVKQKDMSLFKTAEEQYNCFQVFKKYIIVEFEKEFWIVDQHAASERIHYENTKNNPETQSLLVPEVIELSEIQITYLKENTELFKELGFTFDLNSEAITINAVPSGLSSADLRAFWDDLLSQEDLSAKLERNQEDILSIIACHASIRAGQRLSELEMNNLIKDLRNCQNAITCPHGRPTIWKLKINEIDSKFKRA